MKKSRMLAPLSAALVIMAAPTAADAVDGFQGPIFGIDTAPNGDILAAAAPIPEGVAGGYLFAPGRSRVSSNTFESSTGCDNATR
jgi:hypothetical protein